MPTCETATTPMKKIMPPLVTLHALEHTDGRLAFDPPVKCLTIHLNDHDDHLDVRKLDGTWQCGRRVHA